MYNKMNWSGIFLHCVKFRFQKSTNLAKCRRSHFNVFLNSFSYLLKIEFRNKYICYSPALVGPYWEKLCPLSRVRPSACGLGPYSRPRAQFFPILTSRPVNNIYILLKDYFVFFKACQATSRRLVSSTILYEELASVCV